MKATLNFNGLKAPWMAFIVFAVLTACGPKHNDVVPAPQVAIKDAINVTTTAATLVASFTPNDAAATVAFEITEAGTTLNWQPQPVAINLAGQNVKTTIIVTLNMSGLKQGSTYKVRVKASNAGGQVTSDETSFATIAGYDIDGNAFHQTTIGKQIWMVENLKVTKYQNGDPIATSTDPVAWWNATSGLYCWYNFDPNNGKDYGALYNGYVVSDPRGIAPKGWHVPSPEEYTELVTLFGGSYAAAPALMEKGNAHWITTVEPATNSSGFTAIPGGCFTTQTYESVQMLFSEKGNHVYYWTNFQLGATRGATTWGSNCIVYVNNGYKMQYAFSIKCIKDKV